MSVLKFTLLIGALTGCWQPQSWTLSFKYIIYRIYAMFLIISMGLFLLSQFMYIGLKANILLYSLYMLLIVFVAAYKQVYIWTDRKNFIAMINALTKKPFASREPHEMVIQEKFEKMVK